MKLIKMPINDLTDSEPPDIHYCKLKNTYCIHADLDNNPELGFECCNGEYCNVIKGMI